MNSYLRFIVPLLAVALAACGTTSDIKPDGKPAAEGGARQFISPDRQILS